MFLKYVSSLNPPFRSYCQKADHIFTNCAFNNYTELAAVLKDNIIYNKTGIIILNRPYGLMKLPPPEVTAGKSEKKSFIRNITPLPVPLTHLTFTGVIPHLKRTLQLDNKLLLVKAPDRYMSGISVLATNFAAENGVEKALNPFHKKFCTYLAVCNGIPVKGEDVLNLGLQQKVKDEQKKVFFTDNVTRSSINNKKIIHFCVDHKVISKNTELNVSLVEISINRNKWHSLRLYCAHKMLAPVLGDNLFGNYVKNVSGVNVPVDIFHPSTTSYVRLPKRILSSLQLEPKESDSVPLHLHFARLNFLKYAKGRGKVFVAKPPDHFIWTCEKLGLEIPEYYSKNTVYDEMPLQKQELKNKIPNKEDIEYESGNDCEDGEFLDEEPICIDDYEIVNRPN